MRLVLRSSRFPANFDEQKLVSFHVFYDPKLNFKFCGTLEMTLELSDKTLSEVKKWIEKEIKLPASLQVISSDNI